MTLEAGDILASASESEGEGGGDAPRWATEGDVVFANSTCFTADLMQKIAKKCEYMKPGAQIITLTR